MSEVLALILGLLAHMYSSTNVSSWETLVLHKAKGSISQPVFSQTCTRREVLWENAMGKANSSRLLEK